MKQEKLILLKGLLIFASLFSNYRKVK